MIQVFVLGWRWIKISLLRFLFQWNLVCDSAWKVHIAKFSLLVGSIFGYLVMGVMADWYVVFFMNQRSHRCFIPANVPSF